MFLGLMDPVSAATANTQVDSMSPSLSGSHLVVCFGISAILIQSGEQPPVKPCLKWLCFASLLLRACHDDDVHLVGVHSQLALRKGHPGPAGYSWAYSPYLSVRWTKLGDLRLKLQGKEQKTRKSISTRTQHLAEAPLWLTYWELWSNTNKLIWWLNRLAYCLQSSHHHQMIPAGWGPWFWALEAAAAGLCRRCNTQSWEEPVK